MFYQDKEVDSVTKSPRGIHMVYRVNLKGGEFVTMTEAEYVEAFGNTEATFVDTPKVDIKNDMSNPVTSPDGSAEAEALAKAEAERLEAEAQAEAGAEAQAKTEAERLEAEAQAGNNNPQ